MQTILTRSQAAFNASLVGRTLPVLFERPGRHANQMLGRTPYSQWVHADMPADIGGQCIDIVITEAHTNSLAGRVLADSPQAPTVARNTVLEEGRSA